MIQAFVIAVCTAIGGGIGYYVDSPGIGTLIGFIVGVGLAFGAANVVVDCIVDCID